MVIRSQDTSNKNVLIRLKKKGERKEEEIFQKEEESYVNLGGFGLIQF